MNLLSRVIVFAIGFIIVLIAILIIDKSDFLSIFLFIMAIGIMGIGTVFTRMAENNESLIEVDTKTESDTEIQTESVVNSAIKIALIQNYPEAEIISNENDLQRGIFIYDNETYNFEVEDNILFIKQDKKLVKYIYLN